MSKRALVATLLGNWFEFFDFGVYALFAVMIGKQFFPVASASGQLLLSVGTFGAGFIMRPLGGLIIGTYADRAGRKAALTLTIVLMAIGTALIGLTPPYSRIGVLAPIMIVVARLVQGFSAGGEVGAATTYLLEMAPAGQRGLYASGQSASQGLATLCASAMGFGLSSILSPAAMDDWGFRIPFLFGILIGPIGLYIRQHMAETAAPEAHRETARGVLSSLVREHLGLVVIGILTISGGTVNAYIIGKYMTTYAIHTLHLPTSVGMLASSVSGATTTIGSVLGGWLSDRFGRRPIMIVPRILFVVIVYPAFLLVTAHKTASTLFLMIAGLALPHAMSAAVGIVALPECFPRARRTSGLSITYAVGVTVFGGSAQLVVTWLLEATGNAMSIAWYLIAVNVITVVAFFALRPPNERTQLA